MRLKTATLIILFATCFLGCKPKTETTEQSALNQLLADIEAFEKAASPQDSLYGGHHLRGKFAPQTEENFATKAVALADFLRRAENLENLTEAEKISQEVLIYKLTDAQSALQFRMYLIPLNAEGGFYNELNFVLPNLPFKTKADYEAYLHWLPNYAKYLQENVALMRIGMAEGFVLPKVLAQNTLSLLQPWLAKSATPSPFLQPFVNMPASISEADKTALRTKMDALMNAEIYPAYADLYRFIKTEYLPACTENAGVSALPNGKKYYQNRVAHYTTLNISPDSVFNLGLAEVERINALMESVKNDAGFKGPLADYIAFLRTDAQFYAKTPEQILHYAAWLSKKAEGQLPKYFEHLYSNPFTVTPVPAAIAPNYTAGRYSSGSLAMHTAGEYWVNTYNLSSRPLYALPALTLHEAVPGHHLQHALTEELTDLPAFRQQYYISAFGEGWALYCEYLGEEMGMYQTPADWFGRYTYEMWRACRLVVDVGIHYKGWTRQQAVDYLAAHTALSLHEVNTEIDRYIGWPGQALSYKMGELKIKQLRATAEQKLGDKFDIRAFHNMLLSQGAVPLLVLEEIANGWIEAQLAANTTTN